MIRNLDKKIADPKYHGSLIIGAGRHKGEKRKEFVNRIATHNILLAVQCIIECEKDEVYEHTLLEQAKQAARNFENPLNTERGLLALAKMQANTEIVKVFEEVINPNKTHKQVIENLISNAEPSQALDFILLLLDLPRQKYIIIQWAINSISTESLPSNYERVRKLILKLTDNHNPSIFKYKFLLEIIKKYKLEKQSIENIIQQVIEIKDASLLKSAFEIVKEYELDIQFPPENILQQLIEVGTFASLKYAFEIVKEHKLDIQFLENVIQQLMEIKTNQSLKYAFEIVKEHKLDIQFLENVIQQLMEIKTKSSLKLAFEIVKEYKLEKQFPVENIIQQLIENKSYQSLKYAFEIVKEYQLEKLFPVENIIQELISTNNTKSLRYAYELIEQHQLENQFPIENIIDKLINRGSHSLEFALELIKKYSLQSFFKINHLILGKKMIFFPERLSFFKETYDDTEFNAAVSLLIKNYYDNNQLSLTESIIEEYDLWSEFSLDEFIDKAFELKKWGLLTRWHSTYNLEEKYTIQDIIHYAIKNQDKHNAYQIAKEFNLDFSDFYKISVEDTVKCSVKKILKSRVFVKIENETRPASIYIGELANKRLKNINDFEYNGVKLHIGQKLIAKVISIDEQGRVNLSLKYVN
jgi:hypothetical protein